MNKAIFVRHGEARECCDGRISAVGGGNWRLLVWADIALLQGLHTLGNREGPR